MKFILSLLFSTGLAFANDCSLQIDSSQIQVEWTAFKTPAKIGVGGIFTKLGVDKKVLNSSSFEGMLKDVNFSIDTKSVDTKSSSRDKKITSFFFKGVDKIEGKILEADDSSMLLEIKMNGVQKEVPLSGGLDNDNTYSMMGTIDVFDFNMFTHLKAMNKACEALHAGKTWNDVIVKFKAPVKKSCK